MTKKDVGIANLSTILCAMSLPLYKLYEIVFLAENKHGPHFCSYKTVKTVNYNHKTVTKWLSHWDKTKDLVVRPRSRLPRELQWQPGHGD